MNIEPADPHNLATTPEGIYETVVIALEGNSSPEQMQKAESALKAAKGVVKLQVNLEGKQVVITFDPRETGAPALHDALGASGYQAPRQADAMI